MLSKKFSDIVFVGLVVLVVIIVFVIRIIVLNQYDTRIERAEREAENFEAQIAVISRRVEEHHGTLPSMIEMHRIAPDRFSYQRLSDAMITLLETSGIGADEATARQFSIGSSPASFPTGTPFNDIRSDLDPYRVTVQFYTQDLDTIFDFLDRVDDWQQLFVIQNISYDMSEADEHGIFVTIYLITFYAR